LRGVGNVNCAQLALGKESGGTAQELATRKVCHLFAPSQRQALVQWRTPRCIRIFRLERPWDL